MAVGRCCSDFESSARCLSDLGSGLSASATLVAFVVRLVSVVAAASSATIASVCARTCAGKSIATESGCAHSSLPNCRSS